MSRARSSAVLVCVSALLLGALLAASVAQGTTGNTNGFPEPKQVVPVSVADPFTGRYVVGAVGRGAGIRSGEIKIDYSESKATPQFIVGLSEFYRYNEEGRLTIDLLTFYPFHVVKGGVQAVVLGQAIDTYRLGTLTLFTPTSENEVKGELEFEAQGSYPIVLRRLAEGETTGGSPPPAKQLGGGSAGPSAGPSPDTDPGENAGVLAPLLRAVQGISS